ncbi:YEATS family protein [Sarocladium implicatum]|nr:YEATS family protein [Sarocladium implicatum]
MAPRRTAVTRGRAQSKNPDSNTVQRKVKVVTNQSVIDKPSPVAEFPMREWSIRLFILDEAGNEQPADVFTKVVYHLHPTFENPTQTYTKSPFICSNEGWGEFEIGIDCYTTEKTKLQPIVHDLNFQQEKYESIHSVTFKNPSQALQERLRETGPLPNDDDRAGKKKGLSGAGGAGGRKSAQQKHDYEKIAEALEKLEEEDLLRVIQLINENKGPDTYIRSDIEVDDLTEAGEFSIDLYTMPELLTNKLWEHLTKKGLVA